LNLPLLPPATTDNVVAGFSFGGSIPIDVEKLIEELRTDGATWRDAEGVLKVVNDPQFENTGRVHDWRNYILDPVADRWHEFDLASRVAMYAMAEYRAGCEEWE
jgi:hypothetical protein